MQQKRLKISSGGNCMNSQGYNLLMTGVQSIPQANSNLQSLNSPVRSYLQEHKPISKRQSTDKLIKKARSGRIPIVSKRIRQKSMNYDTNLAALQDFFHTKQQNKGKNKMFVWSQKHKKLNKNNQSGITNISRKDIFSTSLPNNSEPGIKAKFAKLSNLYNSHHASQKMVQRIQPKYEKLQNQLKSVKYLNKSGLTQREEKSSRYDISNVSNLYSNEVSSSTVFKRKNKLSKGSSLPKIRYEFPKYKKSPQKLRSMAQLSMSMENSKKTHQREDEMRLLKKIKKLRDKGQLNISYKQKKMEDYVNFMISSKDPKDQKYCPEKITLLVIKNAEKAVQKLTDTILKYNLIDFNQRTHQKMKTILGKKKKNEKIEILELGEIKKSINKHLKITGLGPFDLHWSKIMPNLAQREKQLSQFPCNVPLDKLSFKPKVKILKISIF